MASPQSRPASPQRSTRPSGLNLAPADAAQLLARIVLLYPSEVTLVEQPTVDALRDWLKRTKLGTLDLARVAANLAEETDHYTPDPIWLAWIQVAHAAFFRQLQTAPAPPSRAPSLEAGRPARRVRKALPKRK
jgi:hypothetical protein